MRDNQIFEVLVSVINAGLTNRGYTDVVVQQAYQPTEQGVPSAPNVNIFKLDDTTYGWPSEKSETLVGETKTNYSQYFLSRFQIGAWVQQNPSDTTLLTSSDLCRLVLLILQREATQDVFSLNNMGMLLPNDVKNPYFEDDRGQFQATPYFELTVQHKDIEVLPQDVITQVTYLFTRI
jgi:hypothetical protein